MILLLLMFLFVQCLLQWSTVSDNDDNNNNEITIITKTGQIYFPFSFYIIILFSLPEVSPFP